MEIHQHDGVVTILMNYSSRASPKLRYSIIEEYGGWGHRTRLEEINDQLVCSRVPPAPVYKGARGEAGRPLGRARRGGVLLLVGVGLPFPTPTRRGKGRRRGRRKGRRRPPPSLVQFGPEGEGACGLPWPALSLSTKAHVAH